MPTYNRRAFVPLAIHYFQKQQYANKELIVVDDGTDAVRDLVPDCANIRYFRLEKKITLGAKLNLACSYARGSILVNWDDDDWYADWRLQYQVDALRGSGTGVCGINTLLYYDLRNGKSFQYIYPPNQRTWLLGSSLCYTKQCWSSNKFAEIDVGMDGLFVWSTPPHLVTVLDNHRFSVHMIHGDNVSPKFTDGVWWHTYPAEGILQLMGADWQSYATSDAVPLPKVRTSKTQPTNKPEKQQAYKNIYACLVHESQDCIVDLVHNLHYNDPDSVILLYNGSTNPALIPARSLDEFGAVVHPSPVPAKHGYLHHFALESMQFALDHFSFDCFTIVDSDQLSIRKGYSAYLKQFFAAMPRVGMLSSRPERVAQDNKTNHVALQAFREYELWKPFISSFQNGEDKFVHWTFWPSTVFMADAARDLVKIFKENERLQQIMQCSRIWATEEVILPTLVRLLGYEIHANPCSYDFVRYKQGVSQLELDSALRRTDAYWVHPVARQFHDPLRTRVRRQFNQYQAGESTQGVAHLVLDAAKKTAVLERINKIEGWLSRAEAELLLDTTEKACSSLPSPQVIVEVGCYHGKSTVLMAAAVKESFPHARIVAIDPHDGRLGASDLGLQTFPPSLNPFKKNLEHAGVQNVVEIVQDHCRSIAWNKKISLLLIDGLHDYLNVSHDFRHFSDWLLPGAFVAFHDYADYFPGVKIFVHELLETGLYLKHGVANSLFVLQKK